MKFLNDPSEGSYFKDIIEIAKKSSGKVATIYTDLFNESYFIAFHNPLETYVASFSRNGDSLSMWNYYSSGNGYNIELDFDEHIIRMINGFDSLSIAINELIYDKDYQVELLKKFILGKEEEHDSYLKIRSKGPQIVNGENWGFDTHDIEMDFHEELIKLLLTFKHPAYEREEEVRIIISEKRYLKKEESLIDFRVSLNGVFLDYIKLKLGLKETLKSITVHPLNSSTLYSEGISKYIDSKFDGVKINQSEIPFREV